MKISVIIPVYNVAKYIERCLLSVLNQEWSDIEVILVDDCTPDNSMEIVEKVTEIHPRGNVVKLLRHETNKGQSAARNTAIRVANGDYFYFLDSDDYLPLGSLSTLVKYALTEDYDFILGNYEITGISRALPFLKMKTGPLLENEDILSAYARDLWPRTVWNMLIRKSFLLSEKLYFEEGIIHEDDLWTFQLACKAHSAYFVDKVTYYYYTHFHSTTGNPSLWNLECRVRIIGLMYDFILSSKSLQRNRWAYITFEETKAKYFDQIIYFTKDKAFQCQCYKAFRENSYVSYIQSLALFRPGLFIVFRNLHYLFPLKLGYLYFKQVVLLSYYYLVLPIKLKELFHLK